MTEKNYKLITIYFLIAFLVMLVATIWTDCNLDYAVSYFKETNVDVPIWLSVLLLCTCPLMLAFNIVCEIYKIVTI